MSKEYLESNCALIYLGLKDKFKDLLFCCTLLYLLYILGKKHCVHYTNIVILFPSQGICSVLFETRMGCLNDEVPEETQKFIFSVGEMFRLSPIVILFPKSLWPYMPFWKHFVAVWDHLFKVG